MSLVVVLYHTSTSIITGEAPEVDFRLFFLACLQMWRAQVIHGIVSLSDLPSNAIRPSLHH